MHCCTITSTKVGFVHSQRKQDRKIKPRKCNSIIQRIRASQYLPLFDHLLKHILLDSVLMRDGDTAYDPHNIVSDPVWYPMAITVHNIQTTCRSCYLMRLAAVSLCDDDVTDEVAEDLVAVMTTCLGGAVDVGPADDAIRRLAPSISHISSGTVKTTMVTITASE